MNDIPIYTIPTQVNQEILENSIKNFLTKNKYISDEQNGHTYYRQKHPWFSGQGAIEYSIENGFIIICMYLGSPKHSRPIEKNEFANICYKKVLANLFAELKNVCTDTEENTWDRINDQLKADPYHTKDTRHKWSEITTILAFVGSIAYVILQILGAHVSLINWLVLVGLSYLGLYTKKRFLSIATITIACVSIIISIFIR